MTNSFGGNGRVWPSDGRMRLLLGGRSTAGLCEDVLSQKRVQPPGVGRQIF